MKLRRIYYRRKDASIVIDGKLGNKTVSLCTLPEPNKLIHKLYNKESIFTQEKVEQMYQKLRSVDYKSKRKTKGSRKVRPTIIKRTSKNNQNSDSLT